MEKKRKTKSRKKKSSYALKITGLVLALLLLVGMWIGKSYMWDSLSPKTFYIYVDRSTTLERLLAEVTQYAGKKEASKIKILAKIGGYAPAQYPGAYRVEPGMSALKFYRRLSAGRQDPVRFTFNNLRTKDQFAQRASDVLQMKATDLLAILNDTVKCARYGFDVNTIPALFIPDTYEFYWTVTPEKFMDKMSAAYERFWNEETQAKARQIGLTPEEVSTLAAIVEEETNVKDEMSSVAGLYINRLRIEMPLQADPTVKFAVGDFSIRRVLHAHLLSDSPYNTYKYKGLPPGPIRIPSKAAINAVLNYKHHDYLYMCAKEDFSGRHNFARTLDEHTRNAIRYHKALSQRNIF